MELTNIGVIKDLFERHGFSFTKSLGQNFLVNPAVCPKIAELGGAKAGVCALEIGTGPHKGACGALRKGHCGGDRHLTETYP